ncbi:MAG: hypothetical protein GY816_19355 [Cytophagales bacterium]|nr:hypothetical protein [Cytophagales bacterium]
MKTLITIISISCSLLFQGCKEWHKQCPVCGGMPISTLQIKDDRSKPSKNIAVWNRSICGNSLFETYSTICQKDWYAYSPYFETWTLVLENPDGFSNKLKEGIYSFPLPIVQNLRSLTVYRQVIGRKRTVHSISFWCETDEDYFKKIEAYSKKNRLKLKIDRNKIEGQSFLSAEYEEEK